MYLQYRGKLVPGCRQSFPLSWILGENLLHVGTWLLAGCLVWPLQWHGLPLVTLAWASLVLVVQVALKKHNCSGCFYYGKACHLGWGLLSARMFPQDSGDLKIGMRLSYFYIVSPPLFLLVGILLGVLLQPGAWHWVALGAYVVLNGLSFPLRVQGCRACAIRAVCPGSAAKEG